MLSEARSLDDLTSWLAVRSKFGHDQRFQAALRLSSRHAMIWFNEFVCKQNAEVTLVAALLIIVYLYYRTLLI